MDSIRWHRGQLNEFVRRHEKPWEIAMAALTIAYVGVGFVDDQNIADLNLPANWYAPFLVIFLLEFGVRLYDSPSRATYLRGHWIDLVTSVPMIGGLRLFRILRLLRLVRVSAQVRTTLFQRNRHDTWFIWPTIVLFWVSSAYALWLFEHGVNSHVSTFGDALYLAFITASTVGYGDISPVSIEGQVTAGLIVFFALGLLGFASSRLTTWWLGMQEDQEQKRLMGRLRELEAKLDANETLLLEMRGLLVQQNGRAVHAVAVAAAVM
jgi:voltage-gated potassium channel